MFGTQSAHSRQRFFKFLRRKILTVEWVAYSLQIPLLNENDYATNQQSQVSLQQVKTFI